MDRDDHGKRRRRRKSHAENPMIVRSALVPLVLLVPAPSRAQSVVAIGDGIMGRDGRGALGDFLQEVVADDTQVFVLGYADPPLGGNEFTGCMPCMRALDDRVKALPGVIHVPKRERSIRRMPRTTMLAGVLHLPRHPRRWPGCSSKRSRRPADPRPACLHAP